MSALTPREIFLMEKAYKAGVWYPGLLFDWLASPYSRSVTVGESLISEAPLDTSVSDFLARTGQYVTNDASRDAAISAAVAAERSRCISAVNDERVNNVSEEGVAYNLALDHACAAIQSGTWISTIESIDYLCEQARLAEREACALVCEQSSFPAFTARCFATDIRARSKP